MRREEGVFGAESGTPVYSQPSSHLSRQETAAWGEVRAVSNSELFGKEAKVQPSATG